MQDNPKDLFPVTMPGAWGKSLYPHSGVIFASPDGVDASFITSVWINTKTGKSCENLGDPCNAPKSMQMHDFANDTECDAGTLPEAAGWVSDNIDESDTGSCTSWDDVHAEFDNDDELSLCSTASDVEDDRKELSAEFGTEDDA